MTWHRDDSHALEREQRGVKAPVVATAARAAVSKPAAAQAQHNREHEGYLIKELQQLLRTQIEARIRAKGLWMSFPHSTVLMILCEEPGLSGAQLARRNSVTAQTMNGLLLPLEAKGLIERRPDPENARVLKCYIKPKGKALLQQGMHEAGVVFNLMLGHLSEREREEFRGILRRCIEALQSRGVEATQSNVRHGSLNLGKSSVLRATKQGIKSKTRRFAGSVR
jgi:DNA-binding MarR family transcriptional regulator